MYAKLRFKYDTTAASRNRTIVKAITDCYDGVGPSNFDGYDGIDSSRSYFYSKDSSGWTFAGVGGAQSLGSDSIDYSKDDAWHGSQYTLKSTYDTGHTVYCDVRLRGNATNSGIYGSTTAPTTLVVRNRFGTSIENMQYGNSTMTNPVDADIRGMGISHNQNREIHIMADPTKLVITGTNQTVSTEKEVCAVFQFDRPSQMRYRDKQNTIADSNVPVCALFVTNSTSQTSADFARRDGGAYSSTWDNSGAKAPIAMFPGNMYNERTGDKFRNWGVHGNTSMAVSIYTDDDATQHPSAAPNPNPLSAYYNAYDQFRGYDGQQWGGYSSNDPQAYDALNDGYDIDSNGNKSIRLRPTYFDFAPMGGDEINMSAKAGIYHTIGNAGFFGDSATVNGVTYQYFPLSDRNAMMIRRD